MSGMKIEPVALTTDDQDKSLDHVNQVLGPNAEIKTLPRPQEIADKGDDQDPDMVILRQLEQEAAASAEKPAVETPAQGLDEDEIVEALPPAKQEAVPAAAAPAPKQDKIMIPKERLDAEIQKRLNAENQANYFKGVADASKQMVKAAAQPANETTNQTETPTFEAQLDELDNKRIELAEAYDKGTLTSVEWKRQELAIEKQTRVLTSQQEEVRLNAVRTEARQSAKAETQIAKLDDITASLEAKHPYCAEMQEEDWAVINAKATKQLLAEGNFTAHQLSNDTHAIAAFRQRMAELTDTIGADLIGKPRRTASTPSQETTTQEAPGAKPKTGLSDTAKARADKIALSKTQPPTTSSIGNGGSVNEVTMSDVERMSEEDIAALPQAVLNRLKLAA